MHNGFVTIGEDDQKMSKSLGNFITVHDILKTVDPQVLRFFMAGTQYRMPIRYSEANLKNAANSLNRLKIARENLVYRRANAADGVDAQITAELKTLKDRFIAAMDDDVNVQNGLTVLFDLAKLLNEYANEDTVKQESVNDLLNQYDAWLQILRRARRRILPRVMRFAISWQHKGLFWKTLLKGHGGAENDI